MLRMPAIAVGVLVSCAMAAGCHGPQEPTPMAVSGISPKAGSMLGGTQVSITGVGFKRQATVQFGEAPAKVISATSTLIVAEAPAHPAGTVAITVRNSDAEFGRYTSGYLYEVDPAFAVSGVITELGDEGDISAEGVEVTESATSQSVLTDAAGRYRLSGLRQPSFNLSMRKPGYVIVSIPVTATGDVQVDRRIDRIPSFVLSGIAYEATPAGRLPLPGVVLYCDSCGSPVGHTFVTTDASGFYSFAWTHNGKHWIQFVSKEGYRYAGLTEPAGIPVTVTGNTTFDIELVKR